MTPSAREPGRDFATADAMTWACILLNLGIAALLVFSAFHVDCNRAQRRPVVTWSGPARAWGPHLGTILLVGFLVSILLAWPGLGRKFRLSRPVVASLAALFLTLLSGAVGFGFVCALDED